MREQSQSYQQFSGFDPIGCVGILFVLVMISAVIFNLVDPVLNGTDPDSHNAVLATLPSATPIGQSTAFVAIAELPTRPPPTIAPTLTSAPTKTATPIEPTIPLPTLTPLISHTPTPVPTPTLVPTQVPTEPIVHDLPNDVGGLPITPIPLPTPNEAGDYIERVPILMYHYTSEPPADADKYRLDLSVTPSNLREQLNWLRENGYTTISLYQMVRALANVETLPPKPVILTFDDGHRDNYENAFPILREYGMTATFFIITDLPDEWNEQYMTWPMIQEMAAAGMDMEIHTRSHPDLRERDAAFLLDQIGYSQDRLSAEINRTPRFLAYPGGRYDDATIEVVRNLDLWGAVRTSFGIDHHFDNRFRLDRVRVRNSTSLWQFTRLLDGKY